MILKLTYGDVEIELYPDKAPNHVKRFKELAESGKYDGVVFHRVIEGFMAQTGDVKFGNSNSAEFNLSLAGTGGSDLPNAEYCLSRCGAESKQIKNWLLALSGSADLAAESIPLVCATSVNSALTFGKVIKGMEFVDKIKKGDPRSGAVTSPDKIISIRSK